MKASIDQDGCLSIIPENSVEEFAIKQWFAGLKSIESDFQIKAVTFDRG